MSLIDDYHRWLLMTLDHVVLVAECARLDIPGAFAEGCINRVLTCAGCNGFRNRYRVLAEQRDERTLEAFLAWRDEVFRTRRKQTALRREQELEFFQRRPWEVFLATPTTNIRNPEPTRSFFDRLSMSNSGGAAHHRPNAVRRPRLRCAS